MIEYHILRAMLDPDTFATWRKHIEADELSPPAREVWTVLQHWHGHGTEGSLADHRATALGNWEADRVETFGIGMEQMEAVTIDAPIKTTLRTWQERKMAADLAEKADKFIAEPEKFPRGFSGVVRKHNEKLEALAETMGDGEEQEDYSLSSFEDLLDRLTGKGTMKWKLDCLNDAIGPPYPGMFIVFGGRPESGKTTLLASECTYMLRQLPEGSTLVWFNNEQPKPAVEFRLKQALLKASRDKIKANPKGADEAVAKALGTRRIMVINVFGKTIVDVEHILSRIDNVGLVVFDQASKLSGFEKGAANDADRLLKLSGRLKTLSTDLCPIFTTIWADGSAAGEMWISDNQLYGSKTGIPGEAEAVVNVGHTGEEADKGVRFINIPKNKSMTTQDERKRHGHFTVLIDGVTAEFKNAE